jgi:hypothetical protein
LLQFVAHFLLDLDFLSPNTQRYKSFGALSLSSIYDLNQHQRFNEFAALKILAKPLGSLTLKIIKFHAACSTEALSGFNFCTDVGSKISPLKIPRNIGLPQTQPNRTHVI